MNLTNPSTAPDTPFPFQASAYYSPDEYLHHLRQLIQIPSINPPGLEADVTTYLKTLALDNGLHVTEVPTLHPNRSNLLISLAGQRPDSFAFTGHQDVVPVSEDEQSRWHSPPFQATRVGDYLYGRGSSDMKSGLLSALFALICLKRANIRPAYTLKLLATCDEENYMTGSKTLLQQGALKDVKQLIVCEPTNLQLCSASKGRTWAKIEVQGQTAHGSQKAVGQNAIDLACILMDVVRKLDWSHQKDEWGESFIRTLAISAGVEPQVVPDRCEFTVDARLCPKHDPLSVWQELQVRFDEVLQQHSGASYRLEIQDLREGWVTPADAPLVHRLQHLLHQVNRPTDRLCFAGSTDGTIFRRAGCSTVILGPGDLASVHRENEKVYLPDCYQAIDLYANVTLGWEE